MMKKIKLIFVAVALLFAVPALALDIAPFDSTNKSPLVSIYGLPGPGNFLLLPAGRTEAGMSFALSSNHAVDSNARENVVLDGETTRLIFAFRHALSSALELGIKIPYVSHSGGFLDTSIEDYHSAFGFPQGGRDQAPRDRLLYLYQRGGVDNVRVDGSGSGVGDLSFSAAFQLYQEGGENRRGLVLNTGLKLPTGESDQLRGSGSTDLSLSITGGCDLGRAAGLWTAYGSAGMLFMTEGKVLPAQQKSWVGFGSLGIGWLPLSRLALKVQADAHTPFFSGSELDEIGANAGQLIAGGTVGLMEGMALDIGVSEDLIVKTSPDVVFYLHLRQLF